MDTHQLKQRIDASAKKLATLGNEYIKSKDEWDTGNIGQQCNIIMCLSSVVFYCALPQPNGIRFKRHGRTPEHCWKNKEGRW